MGGIETALLVLQDVRRGKFASESIRKRSAGLTHQERVLSSLLVYSTLRRMSLWNNIVLRYLKNPSRRLSPDVKDSIMVGTAGILDLRNFSPGVLVNGLVQSLKDRGNRGGAGLVNAVLRRITEEGLEILSKITRSEKLEDRSMVAGIPLWVAEHWNETFGTETTDLLLKYCRMKTSLSLRLSPGEDVECMVKALAEKGFDAWPSPVSKNVLRLEDSAYPPDLPGYSSGRITPQSESSIMVGDLVCRLWKGGNIIDMCMGRGIKLGQMAQNLDGVCLEGWELSKARAKAAEREFKRIGVDTRVRIRRGDSLVLKPDGDPAVVFLDAPCSGSGTWNRHPEAKWRFSVEMLDGNGLVQKKLLHKAISMLASGGVVVYSTCSLFREENENVVMDVLKERDDCHGMEIQLDNRYVGEAGSYGIYIWPRLPWLDGFFISAIVKN